jgi:UrcA family protein
MMKHGFALGFLLMLYGAPGAAQVVEVDPDRFAVTLRGVDVHPATPADAHRSSRQIGDAAVIACGATDAGVALVRRAVRRSACWRASMDAAVQQIDHPLLSQAWQARR